MAKAKQGVIVAGSDTHIVPPNSRLAKSEIELLEATADGYEAFHRMGVVLMRIEHDREYEDAGYADFTTYMNDRQPCGMKQAHASRLMQAARIRPLLPDVSKFPGGIWSEKAVRPLAKNKYKDAHGNVIVYSKQDIRRLGREIKKRVKAGEKLTANLVKSVVDEDLGLIRQKEERKWAEVAGAPTPAQVLWEHAGEIRTLFNSLVEWTDENWMDAERESPGVCEAFAAELDRLASLLRS